MNILLKYQLLKYLSSGRLDQNASEIQIQTMKKARKRKAEEKKKQKD